MKGKNSSLKMGINITELKDRVINLLNSNEVVFIVGHDNADFDSLGASIGVAYLCEKFNKKSYIVIGDKLEDINKSNFIILKDINSRFNVISPTLINNYKGSKNLLVVLDTNKEYRICVDSNDFNDVIIIDHHNENDKTIKTLNKFIDPNSSSTCEIIERLNHNLGIKYDPKLFASYILAGIKLDTKGYEKNVSSRTYDSASRLMKSGADIDIVNSLFTESFEKDRLIQNLINGTSIFNYNIAIACEEEGSDIIYTREDLAKAADYLLKFDIDASFVIGKIGNGNYYVSARSKGNVDVGYIMSKFNNGGGSAYSAAVKIEDNISINDIKEALIRYTTPGYYEGTTNIKRHILRR